MSGGKLTGIEYDTDFPAVPSGGHILHDLRAMNFTTMILNRVGSFLCYRKTHTGAEQDMENVRLTHIDVP